MVEALRCYSLALAHDNFRGCHWSRATLKTCPYHNFIVIPHQVKVFRGIKVASKREGGWCKTSRGPPALHTRGSRSSTPFWCSWPTPAKKVGSWLLSKNHLM